jgi:uncharacterized protein (DUF1501 family)
MVEEEDLLSRRSFLRFTGMLAFAAAVPSVVHSEEGRKWNVKPYKSKDVVIYWNGMKIGPFAEDSFIEIKRGE